MQSRTPKGPNKRARRDHVARILKKANDLGCSVAVAALIDDLKKTVAKFSERVDGLSMGVGRSDDPDTVVYRLNRLEERAL